MLFLGMGLTWGAYAMGWYGWAMLKGMTGPGATQLTFSNIFSPVDKTLWGSWATPSQTATTGGGSGGGAGIDQLLSSVGLGSLTGGSKSQPLGGTTGGSNNTGSGGPGNAGTGGSGPFINK